MAEKKEEWLEALKEVGVSLSGLDHLLVLSAAKGQTPFGIALGLNSEKYKVLKGGAHDQELTRLRKLANELYSAVSNEDELAPTVFGLKGILDKIVPKDKPEDVVKAKTALKKIVLEVLKHYSAHGDGKVPSSVQKHLVAANEAVR